jgi:site-specific DNA-methyltransferase (adenine-specific)
MKNKIYHSNYENIIENIEDKSIDLIITDPPYGITKCFWDEKIDVINMWKEFNRVIKSHGNIIIFSKQPFTTDLINANRKNFKYELIWEKTNGTDGVNANRKPINIHEQILVFYDKKGTYNPLMKIREKSKNRYKIGEKDKYLHKIPLIEGNCFMSKVKNKQPFFETGYRYPTTIIKYNNICINGFTCSVANSSLHPTQKPTGLFEYLIEMYSNENDTVLDCFGGSGTTAISCLNTNRNYIVIEKEEKYYNIIIKRIEEWNENDKNNLFSNKEYIRKTDYDKIKKDLLEQ